jgi:glycine betaine/proline transport system substrate-binding protein
LADWVVVQIRRSDLDPGSIENGTGVPNDRENYTVKKLIASLLLALGPMCLPNVALAEPCGEVTIAQMSWQSADLLANIDRIILSEGYGCDARLVPGDTLPTFTSMNSLGEPDVAPEMWINAVREAFDTAVADGRLEIAAESLTDGGVEGWWIPNYIAEAYPEIKSIGDALKRPDLFPSPGDPSRGAVHNCPPAWSCRISTGNLFKAHEAKEKGFDLINADNAEGLSGSIAKAFEGNRGWLGYYWAPTPVLGKYEMVRLDFGVPHNKAEWDNCTAVQDCKNPKRNAWPKSTVYTVVTGDFRRTGGTAYRYLANRSWSNRTVNGLMAWMDDNQATALDGAHYFLQNNEELWSGWVTPEAAENLKSFLANS